MANNATVQVAADVKLFEQQAGAAIRGIESKQVNIKINALPLGQISSDISQITKSLDAANARVIAFGASVGIISALGGAFKAIVGDVINVEKALNEINTLVNTSGANIKRFGDSLFDVARGAATSFDNAAKSANEFARQGLKLEEILQRTSDALILSRLSGLDLTKSIEGLTATVNSFATAGITTTEILNKLAKVDADFAVSSKDLIEGLSRSAAVAQDAKVNFDQLTALITALQQNTARGGAIIGNALKSIFTRIERPQVLSDLEQLGVATKDVSGASLSAIDVLTNLARTYDKLGESQKSAVAEQVGGIFQINLLKSALKDLGGGYSVYSAALQTSLSATNEAILRNQELNKTLSALAAQTATSAVQTGAKVGDKTVAPAISNVLGIANNALQGISDTLDGKGIGDKIGGALANAILDVIGQTLSGPGLVVIGALITKLTLGIAGSVKEAFASIAGQNAATQEQLALQNQIQGILASNPELYSRISSGASSLVTVEKELLSLTEARTAALRAQQAVASSVSAGLFGSGVRAVEGGGLTKKAAGGLIPGEAEDERMQARQAGYEAGNVQTMNVPRLGRVVYNSAEKIKQFPGFDQPAIMPPQGSRGAENYQKYFKSKYGFNPYAAAGFTPNYAESVFDLYNGPSKLEYEPDFLHNLGDISYLGEKGSKGYRGAQATNKLFAEQLSAIRGTIGYAPRVTFGQTGGSNGVYSPVFDRSVIHEKYLGKVSEDDLPFDHVLFHELGHNVNFAAGQNPDLLSRLMTSIGKDQKKYGRGLGSAGISDRRNYSDADVPLEIFADVFANAAVNQRNIPISYSGGDVDIKKLETYKFGRKSGIIPFGQGLVPNYADDFNVVHGTSPQYLEAILKGGLQPRRLDTLQKMISERSAYAGEMYGSQIDNEKAANLLRQQKYPNLPSRLNSVFLSPKDNPFIRGHLIGAKPNPGSYIANLETATDIILGDKDYTKEIAEDYYGNALPYSAANLKKARDRFGIPEILSPGIIPPSRLRLFGAGFIPNYANLADFMNLFGNATTPENSGYAKIASRGTRGAAIRNIVGLHEPDLPESLMGGDLKRLLAGASPETIRKLVKSGVLNGVSGAHVDALSNLEGEGLIPNYAIGDFIDQGIQSDVFDAGNNMVFKRERDDEAARYIRSLNGPDYKMTQQSTKRGLQLLQGIVNRAGIGNQVRSLPLIDSGEGSIFSDKGFYQEKAIGKVPSSVDKIDLMFKLAQAQKIVEAQRGRQLRSTITDLHPGNFRIDDNGVANVFDVLAEKRANNPFLGKGFVPNYAMFQDSFDPSGASSDPDISSSVEGRRLSLATFREDQEGKRVKAGRLKAQLFPDEAHITSVYTEEPFRGQGIAKGLYERLVSEAIGGNRNKITGDLESQDRMANSLRQAYPQLTRAKMGKVSDLTFDDYSVRKNFRIRPEHYEDDIARIEKQLKNLNFADSNPTLTTHFAKGYVPNFSIGDAMLREKDQLAALGFTPQAIQKSIRYAPSSDLPNGGVYNTIQEHSITDGINAAKKAGINPLSKGFEPNFADKIRFTPDAFQSTLSNNPALAQANPGLAAYPQLGAAASNLSKIEQAFASLNKEAIDAGRELDVLSKAEESFIKGRVSEREQISLSAKELVSRVESERRFAVSVQAVEKSLEEVRARALTPNRLPPGGVTVDSLSDQRKFNVGEQLQNILAGTGSRFAGNKEGLEKFEETQVQRVINRQILDQSKEQTRNRADPNSGQIGAVSDFITRQRTRINEGIDSNPFTRTVREGARGLGNTLSRAQLPIIFGSEAVTAGARQIFGQNSGAAAASEAISSAASIGAVVASINPIAGAVTAASIATYKLVDAFSAASIKIRGLTEKIESQKSDTQRTVDSSTAFLTGRNALEEAVGRGANPSEIARLSTKDQKNFSDLTPTIQSAIAGVTDPKEISQRIQEEIEKKTKRDSSSSNELALLSDRKTVFSKFGGVGPEEPSGKDAAQSAAIRTSLGVATLGLSELARGFNFISSDKLRDSADDFARGTGKFSKFDGSTQGDLRLKETIESLRNIPEIEKSQSKGNLAQTLKSSFGFDGKDLDALVTGFKQLASTAKTNEEVVARQNARLIENSQIQNQLTKSVELYNKSLITNAQALSILGQGSIARQRAGNAIVGGAEEAQQAVQSASAKKRLDLLTNAFGVSDSAKSNLEQQNTFADVNNNRTREIRSLTGGVGADTQENILGFTSSLTQLAQSLSAKQQLQSSDAQAAGLVTDNSLGNAQNLSKEAVRALQPALEQLAKASANNNPTETVSALQQLIDTTKEQQRSASSPELRNALGELVNKFQGQQNALAQGFAVVNQTAQRQLQEAIINNEYTQRLIEINKNRSAAGGFEGFLDATKRFNASADALQGLKEFVASNNARPGGLYSGLNGNQQAATAASIDIGKLTKFFEDSANFAGGKGEINKDLADSLARINAVSIQGAASTRLNEFSGAVGGFNVKDLKLSEFIGEFERIQSSKDKVSDRLLDSTTSVSDKADLQRQKDELARQQQDIIATATKQNIGAIGFSASPEEELLKKATLQNIIGTGIRSQSIARDQINGRFDVIGSEKRVDISKLNTTLDTGKATVGELRKLSDIVLTNQNAKEFIGGVERVALETHQLEQRISKDVELIRIGAEKNQLQNRQQSLETNRNGLQADLKTQLLGSTTFGALKNGAGDDLFRGSVVGQAVNGQNASQALGSLKALAEEIKEGSTVRGTIASKQLNAQGLDSGGTVTDILTNLLKFASKGAGTGDETENARLAKAAVDLTQIEGLNKQLDATNRELNPLIVSFEKFKTQVKELNAASSASARASVLQSVTGRTPEEKTKNEEAVRGLFSQLDAQRDKAQELKSSAVKDPNNVDLARDAAKANSDLTRTLSNLPEKLRGLGVGSNSSTVSLAVEGSPTIRSIGGTNPLGSSTTVPGPSSPYQEDANGLRSNSGFTSAGGFISQATALSKAELAARAPAIYGETPGPKDLPKPDPVTGLYNIKGYKGFGSVIPENPEISPESYKGPNREQEQAFVRKDRQDATPQSFRQQDIRASLVQPISQGENLKALDKAAEGATKSIIDFTTILNDNTEKAKTRATDVSKPVTPAGIEQSEQQKTTAATFNIPTSVTINGGAQSVDVDKVVAEFRNQLTEALKAAGISAPIPPGGPNSFEGDKSQLYA